MCKCKQEDCNKKIAVRGFCQKHYQQVYKNEKPFFYAYSRLKSNAKRRGVEVTITFDEFKAFCDKTGYLEGRGRTRNALHIDRIDFTKGYSLDNMQVLTNSQNARKGALERKYKKIGKSVDVALLNAQLSLFQNKLSVT